MATVPDMVSGELFGILLTIVTCLFKWGTSSTAGYVDTCPDTREKWEARSTSQDTTCGGRSEYHCLQDEDGKKKELCVEKSLLKEGFCPIVTQKGFVDWQECNRTTQQGCPNKPYTSNEVYKFPFCFGDNTPSSIKQSNTDDGNGAGKIVGITLGVIVPVVLLIGILFVLYRRRQRGLNYIPKDLEGHPLVPTGTGHHSREEVVKKHHVGEGMSVLKKHNSLLITGKLGMAVTSTADSIMREYALQHDGWQATHCKYQELPVNFSQKTIYFVYGWFGIWNDNPCAEQEVRIACDFLTNALKKSKNENKFIIGMRSDVNKRYSSLWEQFEEILLCNSLSLDSVNRSRDEGYEEHLKNNIICKDKSCNKCKKLKIDMLSKEKENKIGIPLKLAILANDHDLIPEFVQRRNVKETLKEHFKSLKGQDKALYECLMYVCLKGDLKRSTDIDRDLKRKLNFEISKKCFEENMPTLDKYIRMKNSDKQQGVRPENATYVFWHPFIYICAFHALYESNPDEVMKCCNMDAILQLVRPESKSHHKADYFTVTADQDRVKLFQQRVKSEKHLGIEEHPLLKSQAEQSPGGS